MITRATLLAMGNRVKENDQAVDGGYRERRELERRLRQSNDDVRRLLDEVVHLRRKP